MPEEVPLTDKLDGELNNGLAQTSEDESDKKAEKTSKGSSSPTGKEETAKEEEAEKMKDDQKVEESSGNTGASDDPGKQAKTQPAEQDAGKKEKADDGPGSMAGETSPEDPGTQQVGGAFWIIQGPQSNVLIGCVPFFSLIFSYSKYQTKKAWSQHFYRPKPCVGFAPAVIPSLSQPLCCIIH